jgi:hypothetical protein
MLGLAKVGGGALGVCGFLTASGTRSGFEGTCPGKSAVSDSAFLMWFL